MSKSLSMLALLAVEAESQARLLNSGIDPDLGSRSFAPPLKYYVNALQLKLPYVVDYVDAAAESDLLPMAVELVARIGSRGELSWVEFMESEHWKALRLTARRIIEEFSVEASPPKAPLDWSLYCDFFAGGDKPYGS